MKRATWEMFITSDLGCRERKMKRPSLPGDSDLLYQYPDTLVYKAPFEKVAANEQHTFFSVQENNNCSPQKSAKKPFPVSQTTSVLHQPGNEKRRLLFLQPHFPSAMTREQESTRMRRRNARGTENVDLILQTRPRKRPCEKTTTAEGLVESYNISFSLGRVVFSLPETWEFQNLITSKFV